MHSIRMRTGLSLTVCPSLLPRGGVVCSGCVCLLLGVSALGACLLLGGVSALGGVCSGGMSAPGGCLLWGVSAPRGVSALGGVCFGGCLLQGGLLWGVSAPGVSAPGGVPAPGGCGIPVCTEADTPPVNRMTDRCKNITLATTSLRPVKKHLPM